MKADSSTNQSTSLYSSVKLESESTRPLDEAPSYTIWVMFFSLLVLYLMYDALKTLSLFQLSEVQVHNLKHIDQDDLIQHLELKTHRYNFFFTSNTEIATKVKAYPWVKEASITTSFPNKLEIHVVEHIPQGIALLDQMMAVNAEGLPFAPISIEEAGDLPILSGVSPRFFVEGGDIYVGQTLLMRGLEVAKMYQESGISEIRSLSDIYIAETGRVELMLNRTRISLGTGQFRDRLNKIKKILLHLKNKSSDAQYILLSEDQNRAIVHETPPVSYTHLTLPTICSV